MFLGAEGHVKLPFVVYLALIHLHIYLESKCFTWGKYCAEQAMDTSSLRLLKHVK